MATTPTNKPIPSEDPRDLKFNAGKIDEVMTSDAHCYTDRFGVRRWTIAGFQYTAEEAIRNYGYITMDSFEDGATLTLPNQVLRYEATGEYYRWDGEFPKVVPAGSTPDSTGEVKLGAWVSVGDASLRSQLASKLGYSLIGELDSVSGFYGLYGENNSRVKLKSWSSDYILVTGGKPTGGGEFIFRDNMPKSAHNGGTIISPTVPYSDASAFLLGTGETDASGSGCWVRDFDGAINALWFGAVGDGITDDSAAFNAAISALSTRGGSVYVPTGNYKVLNLSIDVRTLDFHGNRIGFFGDGPALSVLIGSSAISTSYVMAVTANTTEAVNSVIAGVSFRDLGFEISNALGTPFKLVNTAYAHFSNCYFKGGRNAFESAGSLSSSFINCKFSEAAQYGFYAHDGFSYPNQLSFFQCVVTSNALAGMYAINPGGLRIYGGSIENNGASSTPTFGGGILIDTVAGATGTSIPIVVSGTYFEFNKGLADLSITHANNFCNTSFSVDGCSFGQGGTYTTVDRVHIVHATTSALRGTVSNCNFHELSGFVPTSANQYIGISGSGAGYRSIFNVNNYFNTAASAPADQTTRIPATAGFAEARIEKFRAVTGTSAATATVSFSMFSATPNVQVTVVDGTANTIYSTRVIAITANACTVEVWKTTPSGGGTWTPATNTSVHILAVGPSK